MQRVTSRSPGGVVTLGATLLTAQDLEPLGGSGMHRHGRAVPLGEILPCALHPGEFDLEGRT